MLKKARKEVVRNTAIESTTNDGDLSIITLLPRTIKSEPLLVQEEEVCYVCTRDVVTTMGAVSG